MSVRGRLRPVALGALGLVGLAAVAITVGRYGASHRHGFVDATLAATVGTALGTTLLATFTAWLAWSNLRDQQERDRHCPYARVGPEISERLRVFVRRFREPPLRFHSTEPRTLPRLLRLARPDIHRSIAPLLRIDL